MSEEPSVVMVVKNKMSVVLTGVSSLDGFECVDRVSVRSCTLVPSRCRSLHRKEEGGRTKGSYF